MHSVRSFTGLHLMTNNLQFDSADDTMACDIGIKTDVYLHSIILGITSVPTAIWLPLFVERLGYIFHLGMLWKWIISYIIIIRKEHRH